MPIGIFYIRICRLLGLFACENSLELSLFDDTDIDGPSFTVCSSLGDLRFPVQDSLYPDCECSQLKPLSPISGRITAAGVIVAYV